LLRALRGKKSLDITKSHVSLKVPGQGALLPSSPIGASTERDAPSPEPVVYTFIHISHSPQIRSFATKWGENVWSMSMEPHADSRPTYNAVWPGSPRGSFITLLILLQCNAAFSMIITTLAWVDHSPVSQHVL